MKLEKLIRKIEEDAEKEIESLSEKHKLDIVRINEAGEEELEKVKQNEEERLKRERKRVIDDYRKEKEFECKMKLLSLSRELLEDVKEEIKKDASNFPLKKKKEILQKKLQESSVLEQKEDFVVFVPQNKKKEFASIFTGVGSEDIREKKMEDDAFVIEGERFVYNVSLPLVIDEVVEENIDFFARLLFKE